jgi:Zn-dependent protease
MLLMLLRIPIELLWILYYAVVAVADLVAGRKRRRFESVVHIRAPRDAVWRFFSAKQIVLDGPPTTIKLVAEPLPGGDDLMLTRVSVAEREVARVVTRTLQHDAEAGITLAQVVPHDQSLPQPEGTDHYAGAMVKEVPSGTAVTRHYEVTFGSFAQRIRLPLGLRGMGTRIKRQCEKEAGTQSRLAQMANHWLVVSLLAVASFWYLLGWQDALLITLVVVLHELGHVAAMRMVGIPVHGIYLIPFFGGVAVPRTAYRSQGQLGFVALMGAGFSLIPTLALIGCYYATADEWALHATLMFAIVNGINLVPIYPLDGGLVLNALLTSLNGRLARAVSWAGVLTGLGVGLYIAPLLLGIPFLLFALGLFLCGTLRGEIRRLSFLGGAALVLAFATTFTAYLGTFVYANHAQAVIEDGTDLTAWGRLLPVPLRCDLPAASREVLDRYLSARSETDGQAMIRTLAWAARAGHGDLVRRRLETAGDIRLPDDIAIARASRIGDWLELARTGSPAAIDAEIAGLPTNRGIVRKILTAALVVHGRYQDAAALLPPATDHPSRALWLHSTLADLVQAGATAEVLALLERTRPDTIATGRSDHLNMLSARLQQAGAGDRKALADAVAQQLRDVLDAHPMGQVPPACVQQQSPGTCTNEDSRALARYFGALGTRIGAVAALVRLGHTDLDLPDDSALSPNWGATLRNLRRLIAEPPTSPRATEVADDAGQAPPSGAQEPDDSYLEIAYELHVALSLSRGDVEKAEALAEASARPGRMAFGIQALMIDHYLRAGNWARADVWARRELDPGSIDTGGLPDKLRTELGYRFHLAEAAAIGGETKLADAALARARELSCQIATQSTDTRDQWSAFLRRVYVLKAFREGRVPAHAITARAL